MTKINWAYYEYEDGTEQWWPHGRNPDELAVERVCSKKHPKNKMSKWCIVSRKDSAGVLYPPVIAGPFPSLKVAQAAFRLITNS
jgi:hypothetical protein